MIGTLIAQALCIICIVVADYFARSHGNVIVLFYELCARGEGKEGVALASPRSAYFGHLSNDRRGELHIVGIVLVR